MIVPLVFTLTRGGSPPPLPATQGRAGSAAGARGATYLLRPTEGLAGSAQGARGATALATFTEGRSASAQGAQGRTARGDGTSCDTSLGTALGVVTPWEAPFTLSQWHSVGDVPAGPIHVDVSLETGATVNWRVFSGPDCDHIASEGTFSGPGCHNFVWPGGPLHMDLVPSLGTSSGTLTVDTGDCP